MNRIRVLSDDVANKIAAGEVVENPASAVKELLENALDAESTEITIEIKSGGKSYISLADNGIGMSRDDAVLAIERHSTSKIRLASDLEKVVTLGFRGEAIPSIASVSRFSITTCEREALIGTFVKVDGGKLVNVVEVGRPPGTTVEVRNLFYNVPARRKYLRSVEQEAAAICRLVDAYALAYPSVYFRLLHNEREVLLAPKTDRMDERLAKVLGKKTAEQFIPFRYEEKGVVAWGYAGHPSVTRTNRMGQLLYVNSRPVVSPPLYYALMLAYKTLVPKGRYPLAVLFVEIAPEFVDMNVHPTKKEVRFKNEWAVRDIVLRGISHALKEADLAPHFLSDQYEKPVEPKGDFEKALARHTEQKSARPWRERDLPGGETAPRRVEPETEAELPMKMRRRSSLRFLSQLSNSYILAEDEEGLVVVDQHAAHERVLYEKVMQGLKGGSCPAQRLLLPATVEVSSGESFVLKENAEFLRRIGFEVRPFGERTFIVEAVPPFFLMGDIKKAVHDFLAAAQESRQEYDSEREKVLVRSACRSAVMAHDRMKPEECEALLARLMSAESPHTCPHGRPTMIKMSLKEIEKRFMRR
jgi:DNA mismatch repair protein MutL